jgi:hypothetical protein
MPFGPPNSSLGRHPATVQALTRSSLARAQGVIGHALETRPAPLPYRPQPTPVQRAINAPSSRSGITQAKGLSGFGLERRPTPPVYKPQARGVQASSVTTRPAQSQARSSARWQGSIPSAPQHKLPAPVFFAHQSTKKGVPTIHRALRSAAVQRYTGYTGNEFGQPGKLSENENYFVPDDGSFLYAATTAAMPRNSTQGSATALKGQRVYHAYVSEAFFEDCLHTAEEIIRAERLETPARHWPKSGIFSEVSATSDKIGISHSDNIAAARGNSLGDDAAPGLGEAYFIVNTQWPRGGAKSPYHAAAVVAMDGNDRVTLEVFASTADAKKRNARGEYAMYSTAGGNGERFHSYWQNRYFKNDSATTVIEPSR